MFLVLVVHMVCARVFIAPSCCISISNLDTHIFGSVSPQNYIQLCNMSKDNDDLRAY